MSSFTDPLDQILELAQSIFNSKRTIKTNDIQTITSLAQTMKNNIINTLIPIIQSPPSQSSPKSKSESASGSYASAVKGQRPQKSTIVIQSEKANVEATICQHLQKSKIPATIHDVTKSNKGNIVLKLNASDDA